MATNREQAGLRVPVDLLGTLTTEAEKAGMSLNSYILMLVRLGRAQLRGSGHVPAHKQQQSA